MSVLVVGLSHRSAPIAVLERAALSPQQVPGLLAVAAAAPHVGEALVLSTCNRVEIYAVVDRFHGGVDDLTGLLADHTGLDTEDLAAHLYVHYDEGAVEHLFSVVCGLDSMVVGEGQILGQTRAALRVAQDTGSAGNLLNDLFQTALRVGKRAHAETEIDRAGSVLVTVGLERAMAPLGSLAGRHVVLVGAGSMGGVVAAALGGRGVASATVVNRTVEHGRRLATLLDGRAVGLEELPMALAGADLVVSCTGSVGHVIELSAAVAAQLERPDRPISYLDLALPRDVDPRVADIDGAFVSSLDDLAVRLGGAERTADIDAVRRIAEEEVTAYLLSRRAARVAPTVVALRRLAADVVAAELARLDVRQPDLDPVVRAEVAQTVRRTVDKLLHAPTVRMKELAAGADGAAYAEALHRLFDLDADQIDLVARGGTVEEARP